MTVILLLQLALVRPLPPHGGRRRTAEGLEHSLASLRKTSGVVQIDVENVRGVGTGFHLPHRALLLATDSSNLERHTLMRHRLTRTLAPHTTENPIFFHATDVSEEGFRRAVDQMASVGFEMLIFSFGSGFNLESTDPLYWAEVKGSISYANAHGVEVGGYDLIALSRSGPLPGSKW